ncbi:MAG: hypothetical protein Satyrvirus7_27 [Satyrvirus sp.]|uniref:Uncharacterized protein n=1 Tax=Satyrvirus sp. TaxID=2487771 RepID=A0A3G5AH81_9VIRU|nr:MAG: hypothetical protein Satyrvirus7_27 [Satyrvirus sp.]
MDPQFGLEQNINYGILDKLAKAIRSADAYMVLQILEKDPTLLHQKRKYCSGAKNYFCADGFVPLERLLLEINEPNRAPLLDLLFKKSLVKPSDFSDKLLEEFSVACKYYSADFKFHHYDLLCVLTKYVPKMKELEPWMEDHKKPSYKTIIIYASIIIACIGVIGYGAYKFG